MARWLRYVNCLPREPRDGQMKTYVRKLYVGIDVHSREHVAAVLPISLLELPGTPWGKVKPITIRNSIEDFERLETAIKSHVSTPEEVAIAVDNTGGHYSEPITYFLLTKGYSVYYLEAKATKVAKERLLDQESKSDVVDSITAAYLLYLRDVHGISLRISVIIPELQSKAATLKSLILQRWQFNKLVVQTTNRLHQFLLAVFPEGEAKHFKQLLKVIPYYPTPRDMLASNGLVKVEKLRQEDRESIMELAADSVGIPGDPYRWLIRELSILRTMYVAKREVLTSVIRKEVAAHPYGDILLSFPYLGEIAAATIIGIIKDIERWPDKKKFKKILGVYSNLTQSGGGAGRTRQGKEGNRHGKRVLFQVCMGCVKTNTPDNDLKDHYMRQVARGKPRLKALVSTMGKLAELIYHCLKAGEPYQYQGIYRDAKARVTKE